MIIDVSKHQGDINWQLLASKLDFVILKATGDKQLNIDPFFIKNATACKEYKIPIHVYCFSRATTPQEAKQEALFLYKTVLGFNPISYIIDIEGSLLNNPQLIEIAQTFIDTLHSLKINTLF